MRTLVSTVVEYRLKCMVSGLRIPDFRAQGFMNFQEQCSGVPRPASVFTSYEESVC